MDMYCVLCEVQTELHVSFNLEERGSSKIKLFSSVPKTFLWMWLLTLGFCQFTSNVLPYRQLHIKNRDQMINMKLHDLNGSLFWLSYPTLANTVGKCLIWKCYCMLVISLVWFQMVEWTHMSVQFTLPLDIWIRREISFRTRIFFSLILISTNIGPVEFSTESSQIHNLCRIQFLCQYNSSFR
jgi:hypothetical protein